MATLVEKLTDPSVRKNVVEACCNLVESEVASKRGFSGAAIKTGYKVVKALKPGMITSAVNSLLPEFAGAMQPLYEKNDGNKDEFTSYIKSNSAETADLLLGVTDAKAERANNRTIKKTYDRLRGSAKDNVQAAIPGLAKTLSPFL